MLSLLYGIELLVSFSYMNVTFVGTTIVGVVNPHFGLQLGQTFLWEVP